RSDDTEAAWAASASVDPTEARNIADPAPTIGRSAATGIAPARSHSGPPGRRCIPSERSGLRGDMRGVPVFPVRRWQSPGGLLQPIAEAAADLICHQDFRLIRPRAGWASTLLFLDCTKPHTRRRCSMAVCGNRAKAAAQRTRRGAE